MGHTAGAVTGTFKACHPCFPRAGSQIIDRQQTSHQMGRVTPGTVLARRPHPEPPDCLSRFVPLCPTALGPCR